MSSAREQCLEKGIVLPRRHQTAIAVDLDLSRLGLGARSGSTTAQQLWCVLDTQWRKAQGRPGSGAVLRGLGSGETAQYPSQIHGGEA